MQSQSGPLYFTSFNGRQAMPTPPFGGGHARYLQLCAEDSCKEGRVRFLSATVPELNTKPCFTLEKQPKFYACGRLPASTLLV